MADIELVIKLDEEKFNILKNKMYCGIYDADLYKAIANGTPLPKGHGDLKDMEDIYEALEGWDDDTGWIVDTIDNLAPTIIEADKAESEDKE